MAQAGFRLFTLDPSAHVNNEADAGRRGAG